MVKGWINIYRPIFKASLETHIKRSNERHFLNAIPRVGSFFGIMITMTHVELLSCGILQFHCLVIRHQSRQLPAVYIL